MIHFLRRNILKKISSKISSVATKKIRVLRGLFRVCSVDLFRVPSVDYSECEISDDSGRLQLYSHLLLELLGLLASNLSEVATR